MTSGNLNPLNAELNSICHLTALLKAHLILHISRIRVKVLESSEPLQACNGTDLTCLNVFIEQQCIKTSGKSSGYNKSSVFFCEVSFVIDIFSWTFPYLSFSHSSRGILYSTSLVFSVFKHIVFMNYRELDVVNVVVLCLGGVILLYA